MLFRSRRNGRVAVTAAVFAAGALTAAVPLTVALAVTRAGRRRDREAFARCLTLFGFTTPTTRSTRDRH